MDIKGIDSTLITLFEFDEIPFTKLLHSSQLSEFQRLFSFNDVQVLQTQNQHPLLAFRLGIFNTQSGNIIIRRADIERRKIVLEIEGNSDTADEILEEFKKVFRELSGDSSENYLNPVIQTRDSVIIAKMGFHAHNIIHPILLEFINKPVIEHSNLEQGDPVANLHTIVFRIDYKPTDDDLLDYRISLSRKDFSLGPRDGTTLDQQIFISKAPLDTMTHLNLLEELETKFSESPPQ